MVEAVFIQSRHTSHYGPQDQHPLRSLIDAANAGEEIWYEFQDGAREGSIARVIDTNIFKSSQYGGYTVYLDRNIVVEVSPAQGNQPAKTIKVGVKYYHNNLKFLVGYTGGHVIKFQKGKPKHVIQETVVPDLLGNNIRIGDWVIFQPKGRFQSPGLGRLNRLSAAGNAWVMTTNKHGNEIEVQTEGANTLIKVTMTPELHATYMLCDSLKGLPTKLVIDLDNGQY